MIKQIVKDVTTVERGVIAHGCNCSHGFGAGVAGAIRRKWPRVYEAFMQMPSGVTMLGTAHLINVSEDDTLFVSNCYTQQFYGSNGRFANPAAIEKSLNQTYSFADVYDLDVYMPQIGCGLGGLDWETEVKPIIEQIDAKWERIDTYICVLE